MPSGPTTVLRALGGPARTRDLLAAGLHPRDLYAARDRGEIVAIARGVWTLPDFDVVDPDLAAVTARMPEVVFGVLTALVMHDLTDEIPREVHVLLPHGRRPPRIPGVPVVGYHVAPGRLSEGIEARRLGGQDIQITDVPRTIADMFKYRSRIGASVARAALSEALRRRATTPGAVMAAAEASGVASVVRPILEVLS